MTQKLEIRGCGVEIDDAHVLGCVQKGIPVIQQNLEDGLRFFEDQSFDVAILSQTLQTIHQTAEILRETVRWHNTPNVRVLTVDDFEVLAPQAGITILDRGVLHEGRAIHWGQNWRGSIAVYRVKKRCI